MNICCCSLHRYRRVWRPRTSRERSEPLVQMASDGAAEKSRQQT